MFMGGPSPPANWSAASDNRPKAIDLYLLRIPHFLLPDLVHPEPDTFLWSRKMVSVGGELRVLHDVERAVCVAHHRLLLDGLHGRPPYGQRPRSKLAPGIPDRQRLPEPGDAGLLQVPQFLCRQHLDRSFPFGPASAAPALQGFS